MASVVNEDRVVPPVIESIDLPDVVTDIEKTYYQHLDELREQHVAIRRDRRGVESVVFLRAEEARTVLQDYARFTSVPIAGTRPYIEDNLLPSTLDPPLHTKFRAAVSPWFAPRAVRELENGMRDLANQLIDNIAGKTECMFIAEFGKLYPAMILCQLMDIPLEDLPFLSKHESVVWTPPADDPDRSINRNAVGAIREYLREKLAERRVKPRNGLMERMMTAEIDGKPLSDHEILMFSLFLCLGGLHTTKGALSRVMIYLAKHPEHQQAVRNDPSLIPAIIEETMRIYTLGETFRRVKEDTVLGGVELKKDMMISAHKPSANRDPRVFDDPSQVKFDRPLSRHIAFGCGPHMCLGMHLARTDMRIALEEWHKRIPTYRMREDYVVREQLFAGVGPDEVPLYWS